MSSRFDQENLVTMWLELTPCCLSRATAIRKAGIPPFCLRSPQRLRHSPSGCDSLEAARWLGTNHPKSRSSNKFRSLPGLFALSAPAGVDCGFWKSRTSSKASAAFSSGTMISRVL
jgi:hypothetical protein